MRVVLTAFLGLALAACGGLFKNKIPPPPMYLRSAASRPAAAGSSENPTPVDLAVLRPRVRAGLDTDRIAALYPDRRMDYFANVRWSGPLDEVVQDLAVQEIHTNPGLRNVSADISVFASPYWLESEVMDFQAEYPASGGAPTAHVHLQARVGSSADRRGIVRLEPQLLQPDADKRLGAL